jgi:hypothetical protein
MNGRMNGMGGTQERKPTYLFARVHSTIPVGTGRAKEQD